MSKELDYIKETGMQIAELNQIINEKDDIIQDLLKEKAELEKEIIKKENEFESLQNLANRWYNEYAKLETKCERLESKCDAFIAAFTLIAPKFADEISNDIKQGEFFSDLLDYVKRCSRW